VPALSGKAATGREPLTLLCGDLHTFRIEALSLTDRPRRRGRCAVLAFFIRSNQDTPPRRAALTGPLRR
ncbi:uncharacterized protein METZ01_LOCUS280336, partial [marine metagenome]